MPRKGFGFGGKTSADSDEFFLVLLKPAHNNHYYIFSIALSSGYRVNPKFCSKNSNQQIE
jgi:hypothetical protein